MGCAQAEPYSAGNEWGSRVRNDDNDDWRGAVLHHAVEHGQFTWVEYEEGDNGRGGVAIGYEPEFGQCAVEVARVECETAEAGAAFGAVTELGREFHPCGQGGGGRWSWVPF